MLLLLKCALTAVRQILRSRGDLMLENLALRHQLEVLTRTRPVRCSSRRTACSGPGYLGCDRSGAGTSSSCDPTPCALAPLGGRRYWSWGSCGRGPGRPRLDPKLAKLIRRMTRENLRWGHTRVLGELRKLGFRVSLQTARRYRKDVPRDLRQSVAHLPDQPPPDLSVGLLHGADADVPDALRLLPHRPRPQADRPLQRHGPPEGGMGVAAADRSDAVGEDPRF